MAGSSIEPLLTARSVRKVYGSTEVLCGVSFELGRGERLALMGPSGSGKSTLLNCLGGIEAPDGGELIFDGRSLGKIGEAARAELRRTHISFVFQFFHLLPTLSARENVEVPLQFAGVSVDERRECAMTLLAEAGVDHRADALPQQLSGGEMQRVALARALINHPALLLADEPTGNLDSQSGEKVLELLERLCDAHNTALVLVTHQPETTRICARSLHMRDGVVLDERAAGVGSASL